MNGKPWTDEEKQKLVELWPDNFTTDLVIIMNRPYSSLVGMAGIMKLKKSKSLLSKMGERLKESGLSHRFTKGMVPPNKGKKMSPELYAKCQATMFKKGNEPHNTNYDGHERISKDGYIEVRIRKGKYVFKHRLLWEQVHGPIPKGKIIRFKDGNPQNIVIENMIMITRKKHAQLTAEYTSTGLSDNYVAGILSHHDEELRETLKNIPELLDLKRQQIVLNRTIKNAQNG